MQSSSPPLTQLSERVPIPEAVTSQAKAAAFWTAIGLPAMYIPLLWSGLSGTKVALFLVLFGANVAALVLGHDYKR